MPIELLKTKFLHVYNFIVNGRKYFVASRRSEEDLVANQEDIKSVTPDAVTCIVIFNDKSTGKSYMLFQNEFRKPVNATLLSVPAGLIDDKGDRDTVIKETAIREIWEETGINATDAKINIVSPCAFASPGFTDECTAIVSVVMDVDSIDSLTFTDENTVGNEQIGKYKVYTAEDATRILFDHTNINPLPMQTMIGILYFQSGLWKN